MVVVLLLVLLVLVLLVLVLPGVLRLLPLSVAGQQHTLVGVAKVAMVAIQDLMDEDEALLISNHRCIIL